MTDNFIPLNKFQIKQEEFDRVDETLYQESEDSYIFVKTFSAQDDPYTDGDNQVKENDVDNKSPLGTQNVTIKQEVEDDDFVKEEMLSNVEVKVREEENKKITLTEQQTYSGRDEPYTDGENQVKENYMGAKLPDTDQNVAIKQEVEDDDYEKESALLNVEVEVREDENDTRMTHTDQQALDEDYEQRYMIPSTSDVSYEPRFGHVSPSSDQNDTNLTRPDLDPTTAELLKYFNNYPIPVKKKGTTKKKNNNSDIKQYQCPDCEYATNTKDRLKRHSLTHSDLKQFKCTECDYATKHKYWLKVHLANHSAIKQFNCSKCDYATNRKNRLNEHILMHANIKHFKCTKCEYAANTNFKLKRHFLTHSDTKQFKCSKCDYATNIKVTLKRHLLTHSDVKQFKCPQCHYETKHKNWLKIHLANHSEIKQYKCSHCDFATNIKSSLKQHVLTHSEVKQFKCSHCEYATNRKHSLKIHARNH